jgi:hypothetical protein
VRVGVMLFLREIPSAFLVFLVEDRQKDASKGFHVTEAGFEFLNALLQFLGHIWFSLIWFLSICPSHTYS